jgi:uroporphyrinogen III methyltransferase / synthase
MAGKVFLVGAGPGDARLITVKGMQCIEQADVVVYDRLANPSLLQHMKRGAEKIYVGKRPDRHTMKQEEINQLLVDLALQGQIVVRLKGGDPTIFGRVGEEAGLLRKYHIPYEIVPGVTAAIAVPAYAGIPVTHRDYASSLSVITGHESPDKPDPGIQWDKISKSTGTLVFMMGVAKIGAISRQLIEQGRTPDTPVALIRWGTRAEQETLTGTLADIEAKVQASDFQPPAVIVVGEVVRLRNELGWAEELPLFGQRVLVTRSKSQASQLSRRIEELGGEPYECPVIETVMPKDEEVLRHSKAVLSSLGEYDWVFFTSVNGVEYFFRHLEAAGADIRSLHRAKIAAVGPATRAALASRGIIAEPLPERYQAEGLVESLNQEWSAGQKALLPRGNLARSWLPEELSMRGLEVTEMIVYETTLPEENDEELLQLLEDNRIHIITFTSSSTVTNLIALLKRMGLADPVALLNKSQIACIGPVTANTAEASGLQVTVTAESSTISSLVEHLCGLRHKIQLN